MRHAGKNKLAIGYAYANKFAFFFSSAQFQIVVSKHQGPFRDIPKISLTIFLLLRHNIFEIAPNMFFHSRSRIGGQEKM